MIYTAPAVIWYTWVQAYTETHENIFLSPLHKDGGIGRIGGLFLFLLPWAGGLEGEAALIALWIFSASLPKAIDFYVKITYNNITFNGKFP